MNTEPDKRPLMDDLILGLKGRCANCGEGHLFKSYLKITDECAECHQQWHHARADDMPAYYVILIVGHIIVTLALFVETHYHPEYWVHLALWLPLTVIMSLLLLQPIKGAVAALQWHTGMHGFKHDKALRDTHLEDTREKNPSI